MDLQNFINIAASAALACAAWFVRVLWESNKDLHRKLTEFKDEIADKYARRDDFREFAREIRELLVAISDKLDRKADK